MRQLVCSLLLAAGALGSGCGNDGGDAADCGPRTYQELLNAINAAQLYNSPDFTSSLQSGRRRFNWSVLVENICSYEHADPVWQLKVFASQLPPGWQVRAGYATSAVTGSEVTLTPSDEGPDRRYFAEKSVGMQQSGVLGVAALAMDIEFSFTSQGDLATDKEVAQRMQPRVIMEVHYSSIKQSNSTSITAP